jgi:hypothetical protein
VKESNRKYGGGSGGRRRRRSRGKYRKPKTSAKTAWRVSNAGINNQAIRAGEMRLWRNSKAMEMKQLWRKRKLGEAASVKVSGEATSNKYQSGGENRRRASGAVAS